MSWHLKHRPRTVAALHLTEVRQALEQMMAQGRFPQVMLFAGPKGTGKTSSARIIGNILNDPANAKLVDHIFFGQPASKQKHFQEPDTDSDFANRIYNGQSFVVQEMDAASYRGIDDVRALKERVMLPPQEGKVAVYILDEAHMFTTEAFNALLKLLEEPPPHAVFILATTELHKIPATIVSRATKIDFRQATQPELIAALTSVAKAEKLKFEPEALTQVAQAADGSFRDAVKLLEAVSTSGELSLEGVEAILGKGLQSVIKQLIEAVVGKDAATVSKVTADLRAQNIQETYFYKNLFATLHQSLLQDLAVETGEPLVSAKIAQFLLQELLNADLKQAAVIPFLPLELKLLSLIDRARTQGGSGAESKRKIIEPVKKTAAVISKPVEREAAPVISAPPVIDQDLQALGKHLMEEWEQFLNLVQQRNATLAALLRSSKPVLTADGMPQVGVYYKFHQEQLQQQKYMTLIQDCARDVVGASLPLTVSLQPAPSSAPLVEVAESAGNLSQLAEEALL
jgi:DNA polymerase-3 subunit gamma/tau